MRPAVGFSPMSDDQWSELKELMRYGLDSGMELIWIGESSRDGLSLCMTLNPTSSTDWSCVPQYIGDPMTEVMRSKLFYARSAVMIAIPTFCQLADSLPISYVGILKNLLAASSKAASFRFLSADGQMTHAIIDAILEKGRYASQEYFGRAWTLVSPLDAKGLTPTG